MLLIKAERHFLYKLPFALSGGQAVIQSVRLMLLFFILFQSFIEFCKLTHSALCKGKLLAARIGKDLLLMQPSTRHSA